MLRKVEITVDITRYGQSALLVQEGSTRVLIDPGSLSGDRVFEIESLTALLFTHDHPDHCAPERVAELIRRNPAAEVYAPRAVLDLLRDSGTKRQHEITPGDRFALGELSIEAVGGQHQLIHPRVPRSINVGLVLRSADGTRLFHPGDSYEATPTGITVLALPLVGPWGSLREAVAFADAIAPKRLFPIHDVHLSESGRALFWPWIQNLTDAAIEGFDPPLGETTPLA